MTPPRKPIPCAVCGAINPRTQSKYCSEPCHRVAFNAREAERRVREREAEARSIADVRAALGMDRRAPRYYECSTLAEADALDKWMRSLGIEKQRRPEW